MSNSVLFSVCMSSRCVSKQEWLNIKYNSSLINCEIVEILLVIFNTCTLATFKLKYCYEKCMKNVFYYHQYVRVLYIKRQSIYLSVNKYLEKFIEWLISRLLQSGQLQINTATFSEHKSFHIKIVLLLWIIFITFY